MKMKKILTIANPDIDWGIYISTKNVEGIYSNIRFDFIKRVDEETKPLAIEEIKNKLKNNISDIIIRDIYGILDASRSRKVLDVGKLLKEMGIRENGFFGKILACTNYKYSPNCSDYSPREYEEAGIDGVISNVGAYRTGIENTEALIKGLRANGYNF